MVRVAGLRLGSLSANRFAAESVPGQDKGTEVQF